MLRRDATRGLERWAHAMKDGRTCVVRRAAEGDAEALIRNINEIGAEGDYILTERLTTSLRQERDWIRSFDNESSVLYVAEVGGRVVGQVDVRLPSFAKARHVANLGIAIVGAFRELGIGHALMERGLAWMKMRGVEKATLEVFSTNERAIALYRKMGFEVEGVRSRHYKIRGAYVDDVLMAKWI
jgi:ribosomal protein S18 acetylase RimI-like enzyme